MNKKRLLCVALTAVLTVSSTAIIAFASENSASTTKNVVKVAVASDKKVVLASKSDKEAFFNTVMYYSSLKTLNISDAQAIQTAKDAIKYYNGVDVDKVTSRDGLKTAIDRVKSLDDIIVTFYSKHDDISATISTLDGKSYMANAMLGNYRKTIIDKNKVKEAAASYLKEKGFGNFTSITVSNEKVPVGIVSASASYANGSVIYLEFEADNNSVISFQG
jgi:hypothetical protein